MRRSIRWLVTLTASLVLMGTAVSAAYTDVPVNGSLTDEVYKAAEYGLMNGYNATYFGYSESMTRAQFTAVLVRMMGWEMESPDRATYADVPIDHKWFMEIETAAAHDVTGTETDFRPQEPVTRGEMAELLVRALGLKAVVNALNTDRDAVSGAYSELHGEMPFTDHLFR